MSDTPKDELSEAVNAALADAPMGMGGTVPVQLGASLAIKAVRPLFDSLQADFTLLKVFESEAVDQLKKELAAMTAERDEIRRAWNEREPQLLAAERDCDELRQRLAQAEEKLAVIGDFANALSGARATAVGAHSKAHSKARGPNRWALDDAARHPSRNGNNGERK